MSYFSDLSRRFYQPNTLNVGWLDGEHRFEKARPPKWMIEKLWLYCRYFLIPAGGFHECNLPNCTGPFKKVKSDLYIADSEEALREEENLREFLRREDLTERVRASFAELLKAVRQKYIKIILGIPPIRSDSPRPLGSDEIRVLGESGRVYAAPNMLYHYVTV